MRTVKRWVEKWFCVPKDEKVSDRSLLRTMLSSVLGIMMCGICLAGLTWAWFSSSVTSTANNITAADFSVTTTFKNSNGEVVDPTFTNEGYSLDSGDYTVTVTATGTASTGYCRIVLNGQTYHTVQLFNNAESDTPSVTFTVNAAEDSKLTITPQWGTFTNTENEKLIGDTQNGLSRIPAADTNAEPKAALTAVLSEAPRETTGTDITYGLTDAEQSYTVQQGDTLSGIANRYGTTVAVLAAYNNIANPDVIQAGVTIEIPPASYKVPEATASQPSATENSAAETSVTEPSQQASDPSSVTSDTEATPSLPQETVSEETTASEPGNGQ